MPGVQVADVALGRMLRAEVAKLKGHHVAQMLLDLSAFYDRAGIQHLAQHGITLGYPLPHLVLGLQAYAGARYLQSEGAVARAIWPDKGILPGCPQAPLMAKLVLWPVLLQLFPELEVEVWIDDIGFAAKGPDPDRVAERLLAAYRFIDEALKQEGLQLSAEKSGILVTDTVLAKCIKARRKTNEPQVYKVLKDLGLDATAGRCRRIATIRKRSAKGKLRYTKLVRLRVGDRACKVRVVKGGIHAVIAYGAEGLGLPPQRMKIPLAQTSLDALFAQEPKLEDPAVTATLRHLTTFHRLVHKWPTEMLPELEAAWERAWEKLSQAVHPWRVAYGPMQATLSYLVQMGWTAPKLFDWRKWRPNADEELRFSLRVTKWELEQFFRQDVVLDAQDRMRNSVDFPVEATEFDWTVSHRIRKTSTKLQKAALLAWHQGSVKYGKTSQLQQCPICAIPLTLRHVIWECQWINERTRALPVELQQRLQEPGLQELWLRGWIHAPELARRSHGQVSLTGTGAWAEFECIDHQPGYCYGLAVKLMGKDPRVHQIVVALVVVEETDQGKRQVV